MEGSSCRTGQGHPTCRCEHLDLVILHCPPDPVPATSLDSLAAQFFPGE